MAAAFGNQYYLNRRKKTGVAPTFQSADDIMKVAVEYIKYAGEHPIDIGGFKKPRPLTHQGFCVYAGICAQTWYNHERRAREQGNQEMVETMARIQEIFTVQKIEHAAAGVFKENIIARLAGLTDKSETEHTVNFSELSEKHLNERIERLLTKATSNEESTD